MTTEDRIPCIPCSPTLEILVPSLKLCQQIPKGAFEDSALVWWGACVYPRIYPDGVRYGHPWHKRGITPAPTLEEILAKMGNFPKCFSTLDYDRYEFYGKHVYMIKFYKLIKETSPRRWFLVSKEHNKSAATAALKLWLELNPSEVKP